MPSGHEDKLLGAMLSHEMRGKTTVSFKQLSKDLDFMERTKTWRSAWRDLIETKNFIEPEVEGAAVFSGEYQMTQAGKDHAATPEYVEFMKEQNFVPQTNAEHQEKIKNRLLNKKAVQIFDKLLAHGSLTRKELATLLGCNDRSHQFSYGFKDLKTKELVEDDGSSGKGKKQRLSDKAFLNPEDRPETAEVDAAELLKGSLEIEGRKRDKTSKEADKKKPKAGKKDSEEIDDDGCGKEETASKKSKKAGKKDSKKGKKDSEDVDDDCIKPENSEKKLKEEDEDAEERNDDVPDAVKSISNAASGKTRKKVKKEENDTDEKDDDVDIPDAIQSDSKEEMKAEAENKDSEEKDDDEDDADMPDTVQSEGKEEKKAKAKENHAEVEDDDDKWFLPDTVKKGGLSAGGKKPPKRKASGEIVWVMDGKTPWQAQLAEPREKKHSHSEGEMVEIQWCHNGKFEMVHSSKVQWDEEDDTNKTGTTRKKSRRSKEKKNYAEDDADEDADEEPDKEDAYGIDVETKETQKKGKRSKRAQDADEDFDADGDPNEDEDDSHDSKSKSKSPSRKRIKL